MGYRSWHLEEDVRVESETGKVFTKSSNVFLGYLSDADKNLRGEEIVEVEIDD